MNNTVSFNRMLYKEKSKLFPQKDLDCIRVTLDYLNHYVKKGKGGDDPIISKSEDVLNETVCDTGKNIIKFLDGNDIAVKVRSGTLTRKNQSKYDYVKL